MKMFFKTVGGRIDAPFIREKNGLLIPAGVRFGVYDDEDGGADEAEEIAEELAEKYIDIATSQEVPDLNVEVVGYNTVGESEVATSNDD